MISSKFLSILYIIALPVESEVCLKMGATFSEIVLAKCIEKRILMNAKSELLHNLSIVIYTIDLYSNFPSEKDSQYFGKTLGFLNLRIDYTTKIHRFYLRFFVIPVPIVRDKIWPRQIGPILFMLTFWKIDFRVRPSLNSSVSGETKKDIFNRFSAKIMLTCSFKLVMWYSSFCSFCHFGTS